MLMGETDMHCKARNAMKAVFGLCVGAALLGAVPHASADILEADFAGTISGIALISILTMRRSTHSARPSRPSSFSTLP
jgi:hypothetical protein